MAEFYAIKRERIEQTLSQIERLPPDEQPTQRMFDDLVFSGSDPDYGQFEQLLGMFRTMRMGTAMLVVTLFRKHSLTLDEAADLLDSY